MQDQKIPRRDWLAREFQDEEHADHFRVEAERLKRLRVPSDSG